MKNNASVKALLFKSKTLKNGEHPIMLRVIKDRKAKYISTGYSCKANLWDFKNELPAKKHPQKSEIETILRKKTTELSSQVMQFDLSDKNFSAETVIKKVRRKKVSISVTAYFDEIIKQLKTANRIGNAEVYTLSRNVFKNFVGGKSLEFKQVDFAFLKSFEAECMERGCKGNTISQYLRTLRAVFNRAIKEGLIEQDIYPFKEYKLTKLNTSTQKRALKFEQIQTIEKLELHPESRLLQSKIIFLFSFYTMGTNIADMANLTWENVKGNRLRYQRAKTNKLYNISLNDKALNVLEYYKAFRTDKYIFPIFSEGTHTTAQQKNDRLHKFTKQTNDDLREIAGLCKIEENLTTYVARHSAATVLKRKGYSTAIISELLGHESEGVTQTYLDSFESPVLDMAVSML